MVVVKANAYGHGAVAIANALATEGCSHFGVATIAEASELRDAGIRARIYLLGGFFAEQAREVIELDITPFIFDVSLVAPLQTAAKELGRKDFAVHLKIDSGATRLGEHNARLGVDTIAGTGLRDEASIEVRFGPIGLATYRAHQGASARRERDALYRLVLPMHLARSVRERWMVGNASQPARIGESGANEDAAVLGVNSYLGAPPQRRSA